MNVNRCYLPPRSRLPAAAGVCASLLCLNTIYTLISMPNYAQYWDYWATLAASLLLAGTCFVLVRRRTELILFPTGILALIACFAPNLVHWMEIALFFLLLLLLLLRLPPIMVYVFRIAGTCFAGIGILGVLVPMFQRIGRLAETGRATADFIVPYVIRSLGGDVLCLLAMLLLIFAMRPYALPGWMDENDRYDRIWE